MDTRLTKNLLRYTNINQRVRDFSGPAAESLARVLQIIVKASQSIVTLEFDQTKLINNKQK